VLPDCDCYAHRVIARVIAEPDLADLHAGQDHQTRR
jgi:hypothetical protein